jgi:hypothetical protein
MSGIALGTLSIFGVTVTIGDYRTDTYLKLHLSIAGN